MSRSEVNKELTKSVANWRLHYQILSERKEFDNFREAENVIADILNIAYYNSEKYIINLNSFATGENFPVIDLLDLRTGIGYQISSNSFGKKVIAVYNKQDKLYERLKSDYLIKDIKEHICRYNLQKSTFIENLFSKSINALNCYVFINLVHTKCYSPRNSDKAELTKNDKFWTLAVLANVISSNCDDEDKIRECIKIINKEIPSPASNPDLEQDLEAIKALRVCFDRDAFKVSANWEGSMDDFYKAIEETQIALRTGQSKDCNGNVIRKFSPKGELKNKSWIKQLEIIDRLLSTIKRNLDNGIKNGSFEYIPGSSGALYYIHDEGLYNLLNDKRKELLDIFSSILIECDLEPLYFEKRELL